MFKCDFSKYYFKATIPTVCYMLKTYFSPIVVLVLPGPTKIQLLVFVNDSDGLRPLWNINGNMNNSWIQARVNYSTKSPHQVPFHNNNKMISFF